MALHERTLFLPADVTVVRFGEAGVRLGCAVVHDSDGQIAIAFGSGVPPNRVRYNEEGVLWIRGHHRNGTPAAEALLAAFKLSQMRE